jgi:hypothetical protein
MTESPVVSVAVCPALHDFIAGTVVIKKEDAGPIQIPAEGV